jgi:hypothetical protein
MIALLLIPDPAMLYPLVVTVDMVIGHILPNNSFVVDSSSWKAVPISGHILPNDSFVVDSRSWKAVPVSGHILPNDSFVVDSRSSNAVPVSGHILYFILFFLFYLSTFIAHYPRVSSKRFTFTLTLLAMLPG